MESTVLEAVWLNETGSCTLVHLAEVSGLNSAELQSLVDSGALAPSPQPDDSLEFTACATISNLTRLAWRWRCACWSGWTRWSVSLNG